MIKTPADVFPSIVIEELRRLNALPAPFAEIDLYTDPMFRIQFNTDTWLQNYFGRGASDVAAMLAMAAWIKAGPKICRISEEQYQIFSAVRVNLELKDFRMPYETILFEMPLGKVHNSCLLYRYNDDILILLSSTSDHAKDIATLLRQKDQVFMDSFLERYETDLQDVAESSCQTLRVSCNMSLAMVNFGHQASLIFPKAFVSDQRLAKEKSLRGERALVRVREAPYEISLNREVVLCHREEEKSVSDATGREMPVHWRRGHWAMQPCGPRFSERKLIFRLPVLVRSDKLAVPKSDLTTVYKV